MPIYQTERKPNVSNRGPVIEKLGPVNSIVEFVQRFFDTAKQGSMRTDPDKIQKRNAASTNAGYHLMIAEVRLVINSCSNLRDRVMIETFAYTGMRRAEIASLSVQDIQWDKGLINVRRGKGGRQRLVPISDTLVANLKTLLSNRVQGEVFLSKQGGRLSVRQVNRIVASAGQRAGVKNPNPKYSNITCHLFRHTFARLWKDQQGSIESLSSILGHQSVRTTWDVYGKESMEQVKANYVKTIAKMYGGQQ